MFLHFKIRKVIYLNKNGKTAERTKIGEKFPDFPIVIVNKAMDNRKTGLETYVTWAHFLSPIGCFVFRDGVGWFHHS